VDIVNSFVNLVVSQHLEGLATTDTNECTKRTMKKIKNILRGHREFFCEPRG